MKKIKPILICLSLLYTQVTFPLMTLAEEVDISESISKNECEFLIVQDVEEENEAVESTVTLGEIESLEQLYNTLNQKITQKQEEVEELKMQLIEHFEALYTELFETDDEFGYLDEEDQQRTVETIDSYRSIEQQIDAIEGELYQLLEERQEVEMKYDQAYYLLEVQEEAKQIDEQTQKELQTCLFYPYSVKKYQPKNILLNNEATSLASYLVSITKYMEKLVPASYTRLSFEAIYDAFLNTQEESSVSDILPEWPLTQETIEEYTYQKELTLPLVQGIAQKAKEHYANTSDQERYTHFYLLVLQMKEAQYKYFYNINGETFEYLKDYLVDYLNTHHYTDTQSIQQIRAFQQRMQVKLVGFNDDAGLWYAVPKDQSGFYLEYQTKDLFDPSNNEFVFEYEDVSASSWLEPKVTQEDSDRLSDEETELSKNNQLTALKDRLSKNKATSPQTKALNKKELKKKNDSEDKKEKELPNTGEVRSKLTTVIIILLIIGLALLLVNYRKKRQQKQSIDDLTLD